MLINKNEMHLSHHEHLSSMIKLCTHLHIIIRLHNYTNVIICIRIIITTSNTTPLTVI